MLSPANISHSTVRAKTTICTGGLNEGASNIEMAAGELSDCLNYYEIEGVNNGYTSASGYERYDGQPSPSGVALERDADLNITGDVAREAARALILPVPGEGEVKGVHIFQGEVYAFRNGVGETDCNMYKESASGWSLIQNFANPITAKVEAINFRFSLYPGGSPNTEVMLWVDGANGLMTYDGTTVATITYPAGIGYPELIGAWKNRCFISFEGGHLLFSAVGDPSDWTTASITGEIFIGGDITTIKEAPGGILVVASRESIQLLYYESLDADFIFRMEEFSGVSGMIPDTVQRILGTLYYVDDRGVTTLEATDAYGDFASNSIDKKVQKTLILLKDSISQALTDREKNQYIVHFASNGTTTGLVYSFSNKTLKGVTKVRYPHEMVIAISGKDSSFNDVSYFGDTDGYVYKRNTGTSFDGELIETVLATTFYSYNTPTRWKDFKNMLFEISSSTDFTFSYNFEYNYLAPAFPLTQPQTEDVDGVGAIWDISKWDLFKWGNGASVTQTSMRLIGYGANMRILISTSSKYNDVHTFHNFTTEYVVGARTLI